MKKSLMTVILIAMAGGAYAADFSALAVNAAGLEALDTAESVPAPAVVKGYVEEMSEVEWVTLDGGKFIMGTTDENDRFDDARPAHEVVIKTFKMAKTAVTVGQYAECVNADACTAPGTGGQCNWGKAGRKFHPVNCVSWDQAGQYARYKDARLPSESEWEYAATSGGRNQKYPWGNESPTCARAVMFGAGEVGCGSGGTLPVCSRPAGNTAQGLCDMAGNVEQWIQDEYHGSYKGAPADGSVFRLPTDRGAAHIQRGGTFQGTQDADLRSYFRSVDIFGGAYPYTFGFRLARSL